MSYRGTGEWRRARVGPGEAEPVGEQVLQDALVQLGQRDDVVEQGRGVERAPRAVRGLDAVGDHDVGVQMRVAGAGVPVIERGRDTPRTSSCTTPAGAGAGEEDVLLGLAERDAIASWCAWWITAWVAASASAHTTDTDFGTLKVRSNPATGRRSRASRAALLGLDRRDRRRAFGAVSVGRQRRDPVRDALPQRQRPVAAAGARAAAPVTGSASIPSRWNSTSSRHYRARSATPAPSFRPASPAPRNRPGGVPDSA